MNNLREIFDNNEWKIIPYCIYYDLTINAVIDSDGKLSLAEQIKSHKKTAMFFLNGDKNYADIIYRSMKMHEFIRKAIDEGADYIDVCNTSNSFKSRYKADEELDFFKKENLDEHLKLNPPETEKFLFLDESDLFVHCDTDRHAVSETTMNNTIDEMIRRKFRQLLKDCDVRSFDELFDLVQKGKELSELDGKN